LQAGFLAAATVAKYGDLGRTEFNYSSNVKPRSESKILTDFSGGTVSKVGASTLARPNGGDSAGKFLAACYFAGGSVYATHSN